MNRSRSPGAGQRRSRWRLVVSVVCCVLLSAVTIAGFELATQVSRMTSTPGDSVGSFGIAFLASEPGLAGRMQLTVNTSGDALLYTHLYRRANQPSEGDSDPEPLGTEIEDGAASITVLFIGDARVTTGLGDLLATDVDLTVHRDVLCDSGYNNIGGCTGRVLAQQVAIPAGNGSVTDLRFKRSLVQHGGRGDVLVDPPRLQLLSSYEMGWLLRSATFFRPSAEQEIVTEASAVRLAQDGFYQEAPGTPGALYPIDDGVLSLVVGQNDTPTWRLQQTTAAPQGARQAPDASGPSPVAQLICLPGRETSDEETGCGSPLAFTAALLDPHAAEVGEQKVLFAGVLFGIAGSVLATALFAGVSRVVRRPAPGQPPVASPPPRATRRPAPSSSGRMVTGMVTLLGAIAWTVSRRGRHKRG